MNRLYAAITGFRCCSLTLLAVSFTLSNLAFADQVDRYTGSSTFYESAMVRVISNDGEGGGVLRIDEIGCETCYEDVLFDSEVKLYTPMGQYKSLTKLANWGDRYVSIKISKRTGLVHSIKVL